MLYVLHKSTHTLESDPSYRIVQIDTLVITRPCRTMIVLGAPLLITRQMQVETFFLHPISYRSIPLRSARLGGAYMSIWQAKTRLGSLLGDYQRKIQNSVKGGKDM